MRHPSNRIPNSRIALAMQAVWDGATVLSWHRYAMTSFPDHWHEQRRPNGGFYSRLSRFSKVAFAFSKESMTHS